jgi:hypothetical protein
MRIGDWDYLIITGVVLFVAGLGWLWGPGAAIATVGVALILAGIGGALGRIPNGRTD